jgi:hypothetical protein
MSRDGDDYKRGEKKKKNWKGHKNIGDNRQGYKFSTGLHSNLWCHGKNPLSNSIRRTPLLLDGH